MVSDVRVLLATALVAALAAAAPAAAADWTRQVRITPRHTLATDMSLALDARGNAVAVGSLDDPPNGSIDYITVTYSARGRGPFGPPEKLLDYFHSPLAAFDADGAAHVALYDDGSLDEFERPPGGEFGPRRQIGSGGGPSQLTLSPAGDLFVVWFALPSDAARAVLRVAVRLRGATRFGPGQRVSARAGRPIESRLALDRAGNAMLVWSTVHRREDGNRVVRLVYSLRPRGGAFGPRHRLGVMATTRSSFALGSNRAGRTVAVWQALGDGHRELRAALGSVASGFAPSMRLVRGRADAPAAAVAPSGDALVVWPKGNGDDWPYSYAKTAHASVSVATAPPGEDLGSPRVVFHGPSNHLVATAGAPDSLVAAWRERPLGALVAARRVGGHWRVSRLGRGDANEVDAGATSGGRAIVVWHARADDGDKHIRASVAEPGADLGPVATIGHLGHRGSIYGGPDLVFDGEDGAFAWWSVGGYEVDPDCCHLVQEHSGSYLLP